jgi:uncharacterized protein YjbI with pentapeptide repeats
MKEKEIHQNHIKDIIWNEEYFKFCYFKDISIEGEHIDSDFIDCTFERLDSYWGLYNLSNFIDCIFIECCFRGCSFPDSKFINCKFEQCHFLKDNMDSECTFNRTQFINCVNPPV